MFLFYFWLTCKFIAWLRGTKNGRASNKPASGGPWVNGGGFASISLFVFKRFPFSFFYQDVCVFFGKSVLDWVRSVFSKSDFCIALKRTYLRINPKFETNRIKNGFPRTFLNFIIWITSGKMIIMSHWLRDCSYNILIYLLPEFGLSSTPFFYTKNDVFLVRTLITKLLEVDDNS